MPTNDPIKNRAFVKKSQQKKKEQIGIEEFNRIHNEKQTIYRQNLINQKGIDIVRKEKAEYMRQYRLKQKQEKEKEKERNKSIIKIQNAIRNKNAIKTFTHKYVDKNTSIIQNKATMIQNAYRMKLARQKVFEKIADSFLLPSELIPF